MDALWHMDPSRAQQMASQLDSHNVLWLECPLLPELPAEHAKLAQNVRTPLALGESYRTRFELLPYWESIQFVQPDLGRSGLTESLKIGEEAAARKIALVPHVSIALGPQIAAAIHLASGAANCDLCEYNPRVLETANRFLKTPIALEGNNYRIPEGPGLGIDIDETALRAANLF